jgi:uncharacterized protein (TIRG00374 family)
VKIIILTLKILISSYLIFFLYKNNYIDLNFLNKISFLSFVTVFLLSCLTYLLCAYRWKIILEKVKIKLSFWVSFKLTYMSIFFSNFFLGQQGGDLLRGYYLWDKYKSKRLFIINSIIIDRFFGILGLLILLLFFSFFMENRIFFIITLILTITMFFSLFCLNFLLKKRGAKYNFIFSYLYNCKKIIKIFFKNNIKSTLILIIISLFQFFILTFSIYVISVDILGVSAIFFTQMALGLASFFINSLPIAISGIGIGEISFQFLNNMIAPNNNFQFATFFLINRIIYILSSSFSIIVFIFHKKSK